MSPSHHHGSMTPMLLASVGAILFSAKAIVVKLSYPYGASPEVILALRMLFSLPLFWFAAWWASRRQDWVPLSWRDRFVLFALGFIGYYLSSYLDFLGLQFISASLERIILYLNPTLVLILSALFVGKRIERGQWPAMAVAYLGVLLVFVQDVRWDGPQVMLGAGLVFLSAISYAVYLILAGEVVRRIGSIRVVAYACTSSCFFSLLQALIVNPSALITQSPEVYGLSLINASICTFVPMLLIMMALRRIGPGLTAQSGMVGPVAVVGLAWFFLDERISLVQLAGIGIVLTSMAMLVRVGRARTPTDPV